MKGYSQKRFVFISRMEDGPWGGSEELWSASALVLGAAGFAVEAHVRGWSPPPHRIVELMKAGIQIHSRPGQYSLWRRSWQKLVDPQKPILTSEIEKALRRNAPNLVVFNEGAALPPPDLIEVCVKHRWPFVTICQANHEQWWPSDEVARRYRDALAHAKRCFFVSQANRALTEKQIGCDLPNAQVVRNPFGVPYDVSGVWPWPPPTSDEEVRFACVARLVPEAKGQDLLLEALATPAWQDRRWRLTFYGEGICRDIIRRMVEKLELSQRVVFAGHVPVQEIWRTNHVLVLILDMKAYRWLSLRRCCVGGLC